MKNIFIPTSQIPNVSLKEIFCAIILYSSSKIVIRVEIYIECEDNNEII